MVFDNGWMLDEHFREACAISAADLSGQLLAENGEKFDLMGTVVFHFTSAWWSILNEHRGQLVVPTILAIVSFVKHLEEEHDMPAEHIPGATAFFYRYTAHVITRAGGRLIRR